jgi:hypothetical protein
MYCMCVNVYCHRVTTQLQIINILIYQYIIIIIIIMCHCTMFHMNFEMSHPACVDQLYNQKKMY